MVAMDRLVSAKRGCGVVACYTSKWNTNSVVQVCCGGGTSSSPKRLWCGCDGPTGVCTRCCGAVVSSRSKWDTNSVVQVCCGGATSLSPRSFCCCLDGMLWRVCVVVPNGILAASYRCAAAGLLVARPSCCHVVVGDRTMSAPEPVAWLCCFSECDTNSVVQVCCGGATGGSSRKS